MGEQGEGDEFIEPIATMLRLLEELNEDWTTVPVESSATRDVIRWLEIIQAIETEPESCDDTAPPAFRVRARLAGLGTAWHSGLKANPARTKPLIIQGFLELVRRERGRLEAVDIKAAELDAECDAAIARVERPTGGEIDRGPIPVKNDNHAIAVLGETNRNYPALKRMIAAGAIRLEDRKGGGKWLHISDPRDRRLAWERFDGSR